MREDNETLKVVRNEFIKIRDKYVPKAEKERQKVNDCFVTINGEKCYSIEEINEFYQYDYITESQCTKYISQLEKKQKISTSLDEKTKSEKVVSMFDCYIEGLAITISEQEKEENIAREYEARRHDAIDIRGLSFKEFEAEEILRNEKEWHDKVGEERERLGLD